MTENTLYLKCCGNCKHFKHEDTVGNGLCEVKDKITNCSKICDKFIYYKTKNNDKQKNIL